MNERKYFAVSLKHLYPWKFGDKLCLWGYKRTKDNEERCFGGYTECVENAELYSIEEFCGAYNKTIPHLMKEEPVKIDYKQWRSLKAHYDSVLVAREDVESYYKMCGFMKDGAK